MSHGSRLALLGLVPLALPLVGLILFYEVLLPFRIGVAAAYLLDPAADQLQRWGLGRTAAIGVMLVLILPTLVTQAAELAAELPGYLERLRERLVPSVAALLTRGNLISPRLVRAGTVLAGVLGTLLALAVAAVVGVLPRFGPERYHASPLFGPPAPGAGE